MTFPVKSGMSLVEKWLFGGKPSSTKDGTMPMVVVRGKDYGIGALLSQFGGSIYTRQYGLRTVQEGMKEPLFEYFPSLQHDVCETFTVAVEL